tara:strand:- start:4417 stop:5175 length:759 start_codon:yes stop_codon:yes gene_type:complete
MGRYGSRWSRDETLLAFGLYCELPFGRLHQNNPDIVALAQTIGRTPSSVAMKACNFASLDPAQRERGITGLANASKTEQSIWDEFLSDSVAVVDAIDRARAQIDDTPAVEQIIHPPSGPSESLAEVRIRRHQRFFRSAVLSTYGNRCALTSINIPDLLVASHIVPWSQSKTRRCDPTNGLCLNALHDRAFDRGLITFDTNLCLVASQTLTKDRDLGLLRDTLSLVGRRLNVPDRFQPDADALRFHRESVFKR